MLRQHDQVMVYMSRQLKEYEIRYPTHDLKLEAIVFALRLRRHYLYGEMCISYTDYKSLKYVQRRWLELIKEIIVQLITT